MTPTADLWAIRMAANRLTGNLAVLAGLTTSAANRPLTTDELKQAQAQLRMALDAGHAMTKALGNLNDESLRTALLTQGNPSHN